MNDARKIHRGANKHCVFGACNSDSRKGRPGYDPHTVFYAFPKPCLTMRKLNIHDEKIRSEHVNKCRHCEHCHLWVKKCKRNDVKFQSIANITKDTYICGKHFPPSLTRGFDHTTVFPLPVNDVNLQKIPEERRILEKLSRKATSELDTGTESLTGDNGMQLDEMEVSFETQRKEIGVSATVSSAPAQNTRVLCAPVLTQTTFVFFVLKEKKNSEN